MKTLSFLQNRKARLVTAIQPNKKKRKKKIHQPLQKERYCTFAKLNWLTAAEQQNHHWSKNTSWSEQELYTVWKWTSRSSEMRAATWLFIAASRLETATVSANLTLASRRPYKNNLGICSPQQRNQHSKHIQFRKHSLRRRRFFKKRKSFKKNLFKKSTVENESREIVWKGHQCVWLFHFFFKKNLRSTVFWIII